LDFPPYKEKGISVNLLTLNTTTLLLGMLWFGGDVRCLQCGRWL